MVTVHVDVQLLKKIGKDNLLQILENEGYPCELEILSDQKRQKSAYPKDGTYILTLKIANHYWSTKMKTMNKHPMSLS